MNKAVISCTFILLFMCFGCHSQDEIVVHELKVKNTVNHTFNFPLNDLKDSILKIFQDQDSDKYLVSIFTGGDYYGSRSPTQQTFFARSKKDSVLNAYFYESGRDNDIYLFPLTGTWGSKMYFANGKSLQFQSAYILHFDSLNQKQTRMTVKAEDPFVVNGMDGVGVHGPKRKTEKVPPTTIEEYTIILFIASKLGENNLPPLLLPN